jgi:hypothetical protein
MATQACCTRPTHCQKRFCDRRVLDRSRTRDYKGSVQEPASELAADVGTALSSADAFAGEHVERPEPGLARGRWEAPPSVFYGVAAAALVGGVAVAIRGLRRRRG